MKEKRCCSQCGRTFEAKAATTGSISFCSLGCALFGRVPIDANGQYPINGAVLSGLALGLLAFNEFLFATLGSVLSHRGQLVLAARCIWASAGAGGALFFSMIALAWWTQTLRRSETIASFVGLVLGVWILAPPWPPSPWTLMGLNTLVLLGYFWSYFSKTLRRKNAVRI